MTDEVDRSDIDASTADALLAGGYAEKIDADAPEVVVETAAIIAPEHATGAPQRRRKG